MDSGLNFYSARALLQWQVELGADEAICDTPVNRYELPDTAPKPASAARPARAGASVVRPVAAAPAVHSQDDAVGAARQAAAAAGDLDGLRAALAAYEHCDLKRGARNLVFADGDPSSQVMIIGEAPGRDEDRAGQPFVGATGQMLNRMLGAIGLDRTATGADGVYITNVLPWRPPQNRDPSPQDIDMMRPFVARHVQLVQPKVLILMGNISCQAGLDKRGVTRLRGTWTEAWGVPALPMVHPAYLLRTPAAKRAAWADLLEVQARLRALTSEGAS
ncbi:uracil-DNA glycosylase [Rhodobacteraceae bacterium KMM 6894]|nr:uracil-DNA glycosylase [Rhodobacteraceae bacterium KMM 6894]